MTYRLPPLVLNALRPVDPRVDMKDPGLATGSWG